MFESSIEKKLREGITKRGGLCLKLSAQFFEGMPDRLIMLPGGRIDLIETKRPYSGRLSPRQKYVHRLMLDLGIKVKIINSPEKVKKYLEEC